MGIDITAYDCRRPNEIWPDAKGEGVTLFKDLNYFRTGTQIQPSLKKNSFEVWPLQADCVQHFRHLLQVLHTTIE